MGQGETEKAPTAGAVEAHLCCKTLFQAHLFGFISRPPRVCLAQIGGAFNGICVTILLSHDGHFHVIDLEWLTSVLKSKSV
jgi:hypothetical protein